MRRTRSGQSVVELMLYISVIVVGIIAVAWLVFDPAFKDGFDELRDNVSVVLSNEGAAGGDVR